jgi:hypothetical protein
MPFAVTPPRLLALTLACCSGACARAVQEPQPNDPPEQILERAIDQAGGAEALEAARGFAWDGAAVVTAGGRDVRIAGRWEVQPPDTAVVATYDVTQGAGATRSLVLAAPRGWLVSGDRFSPLPATMMASERSEFYLYELIRLVTLTDTAVTLSSAPADTVGQTGIKVEQPGRPTAFLFMDTCGRLSHVRLQVPSAETGKLEWQDAWLTGVIEAEGVRWPRELRLLVDGKPYFDLLLQSLKVHPRLTNPLLRGPAGKE